MNDDDQPTPEELAEAQALARALEDGGTGGDEAAAAAALLRHARAADAQPDVVDARVRAAAARALAAPREVRPRRNWWRWLLPVGLVPAAAAIALVVMVQRRAPEALSSVASAPLPRPEAALLESQRRAARGNADLAALDRQMRTYREALYAALAEREGDQ